MQCHERVFQAFWPAWLRCFMAVVRWALALQGLFCCPMGASTPQSSVPRKINGRATQLHRSGRPSHSRALHYIHSTLVQLLPSIRNSAIILAMRFASLLAPILVLCSAFLAPVAVASDHASARARGGGLVALAVRQLFSDNMMSLTAVIPVARPSRGFVRRRCIARDGRRCEPVATHVARSNAESVSLHCQSAA